MKVLCACEFSGTVRDAFIRRGHDAMSCDLLPTSVPGPHYQGDVRNILGAGWNLLIGHPPCTYLCSSGMHWTTRGFRNSELTEEALAFVRELLEAPIEKIAIENPVGCISTRIREPDQILQPWMFGHDASKSTCLWLKNLPLLVATEIIPPAGYRNADSGDIGSVSSNLFASRAGFQFVAIKEPVPKKLIWGNQTPSGQNKLGPSDDRWAERSTTYKGLAEAMAEQWS